MCMAVLVMKDASLYRSLKVNDLFLREMHYQIESHLVSQMLQIAEYHERAVVSVNSLKRPSMKVRKQKLLAFLRGILIF